MDDESKLVLEYLAEIEEAAEDVLSTKQQVIISRCMPLLRGESNIVRAWKLAKRISREASWLVVRLVREAMLH